MPITSLRSRASLALVPGAVACTPDTSIPAAQPDLSVPAWAQDVVWYQVFPERFRNGDPSNDPTAQDIAPFTPDPVPTGWAPTPWGQDWYAQEPWAKATGKDFYGTAQFRRYGGDLQGLLDKLDYLQELGITALYLNPINDAPSLHKYDARSYHHIDHTFGPDPRGDEAIVTSEDPANPQHLAVDQRQLPLPQADCRGASSRHADHRGLLVESHGGQLLGVAGRGAAPGDF